MGTIAVSFIILFGSSYGISSVLLKKNIRIHDPSYRSQEHLEEFIESRV
ncbi:MAG: hypothetical protein CM15mV37_0800 [uncultured marine virus]|nr:MAG: hypothetical protein CM15mV37_0800 [uncultured marine virus]